jgi:Zn-dependent protease
MSPLRANAPRPRDTGAYRIATVAGIPIRLHWTFFLLLTWVAFVSLGAPSQGRLPMEPLLFVVAIFGCIALHELGHALMALRYGIRTRDIVLYPIGGIASLEKSPRAREELWIALAGPAVNVVIAGLIYIGLKAVGQPIPMFQWGRTSSYFLADVMHTNLWLFLFNMIPAFPMDGGRVLRSLLAYGMDEASATGLAARIGQGIAIAMGLVGLLNGWPLLMIIALFVYFGAGQEAAAIQTRVLTEGHRVREAMQRNFQTLTVGNTLRDASDALLAGSQQDFPVMHAGEVVGVLSRAALLRGIASAGPDSYLAGVMDRNFARIGPDELLETALQQFPSLREGPILVMEGETPETARLVGMLTQENLLEFLMLQQLQSRRS